MRVTFHCLHPTRMLATGSQFTEDLKLCRSGRPCSVFVSQKVCFISTINADVRAIRPPAAAAALSRRICTVQYTARRIRCAMMARRQLGGPSERPTRSALHHRLRRCRLAGRQTRRRTGWAITCSFNTKSAERRNAERRRRPANATRRNKTVAMSCTKTFAIQTFFSSFIGMHSLRCRTFARTSSLLFYYTVRQISLRNILFS